MFQSDKKSSSLGSILDPNIEINGDISVSENLIIYGKINGNVHSTKTVNAAKGSSINGNIIAQNALIGGEMQGDLDIKEKITLGSSANLRGNLKASILTVEEGAKFDGMCNMLKTAPAESKVKKINTISS